MAGLFSETEAAQVSEGSGFARVSQKAAEQRAVPVSVPRAMGRDTVRLYKEEDVRLANVRGGYASSNATLDAQTYTKLLNDLYVAAGLRNGPHGDFTVLPDIIARYDRLLSWCHALNSASQLTPGRAAIHLGTGPADVPIYYASGVLQVLGEDARRFFRYRADQTYLDLKWLYDNKVDLTGDEKDTLLTLEIHAASKGLARYPCFAFDTAEYVSHAYMGVTERAAVMLAKSQLTVNVDNLVDVVKAERHMAGQVAKQTASSRSPAPFDI